MMLINKDRVEGTLLSCLFMTVFFLNWYNEKYYLCKIHIDGGNSNYLIDEKNIDLLRKSTQ